MSIFDMFKPAGSNSQQPPAQGSNQNNNQGQPNAGSQGQAPTGQPNQGQPSGITAGVANAGQPANAQPENPLDNFKGMFDTSSNNQDTAPTFSLPDDVLSKVATGQDFTQGISQELMNKALSGDAQSLISLINATAQNAYKQSLAHTSSLTDKFINSRLDFEGKSLSGKVKNELTQSELSANTPGFNHPVVKAQLTEVAKQLARQYPEASPQEIASKAKDYVVQLANAINPSAGNSNSGTPNGTTTAAATDWDNYFG